MSHHDNFDFSDDPQVTGTPMSVAPTVIALSAIILGAAYVASVASSPAPVESVPVKVARPAASAPVAKP